MSEADKYLQPEEFELTETSEQRVFAQGERRGVSLFYTAPGLFAAHTVSDTFVNGSTPARRKARVLGLMMIVMIAAPTLLALLANIFLR